ncbi:MAG: hypothetical protein ACE5GC_01010 [Acidimicrobiia bacterium]
MVESIMALMLVVLLFVGVATTLQIAIRHQRDVRLQQQATALAIEYVEFARSVSWAELALSETPPAEVPNISGAFVLGAPFDLPGDEALVIDATDGLIAPSNPGGETINGQSFDVYQYVSDVEPGLRRFTVLVEWDSGRISHDHFTSAQVSEVGSA